MENETMANKQFKVKHGLEVQNNITASGDISASGIISAQSLEVGGGIGGSGLSATDIYASGHITASGNISASGTQHSLSGSLNVDVGVNSIILGPISNGLYTDISSTGTLFIQATSNGITQIGGNLIPTATLGAE